MRVYEKGLWLSVFLLPLGCAEAGAEEDLALDPEAGIEGEIGQTTQAHRRCQFLWWNTCGNGGGEQGPPGPAGPAGPYRLEVMIVLLP